MSLKNYMGVQEEGMGVEEEFVLKNWISKERKVQNRNLG